MEQISINLNLEEVNQILEALGQRPYVEVFQLIGKIKFQAEMQVQASETRKQVLNTLESKDNDVYATSNLSS